MNTNGISWIQEPLIGSTYQVVSTPVSSSSSSSSSSSVVAAVSSASDVTTDTGGGRRKTESIARSYLHRSAPETFIRFKPLPSFTRPPVTAPSDTHGPVEEQEDVNQDKKNIRRGILDRYKLRRWQDIIPNYVTPSLYKFAAPQEGFLRDIRFMPLTGIQLPSNLTATPKRENRIHRSADETPWFVGSPTILKGDDESLVGNQMKSIFLLLLLVVITIGFEVQKSKSSSAPTVKKRRG
ncbi:MAG: hypothetical protein O2904_00030 [bacterium]|nr:hypothetical protein [bacterium]